MKRSIFVLLGLFIISFAWIPQAHAANSKLTPSPPRNIRIEQKDDAVLLSWEKPRTKNFSGFRIYRSQKIGNLGNLLQKTNKNTFSFLDSSIQKDVTYFYTVRTGWSNGRKSKNKRQLSIKVPTIHADIPSEEMKLKVNILVILTDKVAIITSNEPSSVFQNVEKAEAEKVFFDETNSVRSYFKENSYGKIDIEGEVTDAMTGFAGRPMQDLIDALDPSVNFSPYDYFFFITLNDGACDGAATLGKTAQFTTQDGAITVGYGMGPVQCLKDFYDSQKVSEIIHELGHTFGLQHTGSWLKNPSIGCSDIPLENVPNSSCYSTYGATPMGTGRGDLFVFQRNILAAPFSAPALTITEDGDFWVHSFQNNPSLQYYEELRIPANNGYYSLEFRHNITSEITKGVMINFVPNDNAGFFGPLSNAGGIAELLVDAPANSLSAEDPLLNSSFTDSLRNISVKVLRLEENRALLRISYGS